MGVPTIENGIFQYHGIMSDYTTNERQLIELARRLSGSGGGPSEESFTIQQQLLQCARQLRDQTAPEQIAVAPTIQTTHEDLPDTSRMSNSLRSPSPLRLQQVHQTNGSSLLPEVEVPVRPQPHHLPLFQAPNWQQSDLNVPTLRTSERMTGPSSNHRMPSPSFNHQVPDPSSNHRMPSPSFNHQMPTSSGSTQNVQMPRGVPTLRTSEVISGPSFNHQMSSSSYSTHCWRPSQNFQPSRDAHPMKTRKRRTPFPVSNVKETNEEFDVPKIILMHNSNCIAPKPSLIGELRRNGMVKDFHPFKTGLTAFQVKVELVSLFSQYLSDTNDFFICLREGEHLNPPDTKRPLDGVQLRKSFHNKNMFLVPLRTLLDLDDTPRKSRRTSKTPARFDEFELNSKSEEFSEEEDEEEEVVQQQASTDRLAQTLASLKPPLHKKITIFVTRDQILLSAVSFLLDEMHFDRTLVVKFTDLVGTEEEGIDGGGPRREFFDMCLDDIIKLPLFEGEVAKDIVYIEDSYEQRLYFYIAVIIGMSIIQGGPPPNFFSASCYEKIISWKLKEDEEGNLEKAVDQFQDGLIASGLYQEMLADPQLFKPLFLLSFSVPTIEKFKSMLKYNRSEDATSADFAAENAVIVLWQRLLRKIERNQISLSLAHILSFACGSKRLPAVGFDKKIDIFFNHANKEDKYPHGGTCGLQIILPMLRLSPKDFDEFASELEFGIRNSLGHFGSF